MPGELWFIFQRVPEIQVPGITHFWPCDPNWFKWWRIVIWRLVLSKIPGNQAPSCVKCHDCGSQAVSSKQFLRYVFFSSYRRGPEAQSLMEFIPGPVTTECLNWGEHLTQQLIQVLFSVHTPCSCVELQSHFSSWQIRMYMKLSMWLWAFIR